MSQRDFQELLAFLRTHCGTEACNPLALLSAAQLVRDLPTEQVALFQQALAEVALDPSLAALIAHKLKHRTLLETAH